jgi:hypothetical protein
MGRASDTLKAERLNRARTLLSEFDKLPDAVEQMAQDCSISRGPERLQTDSRGLNCRCCLAWQNECRGSCFRFWYQDNVWHVKNGARFDTMGLADLNRRKADGEKA